MPGQIMRTKRIRKYLDETLSSCTPGTKIFSDELARAFCIRHHGESNRDIGMALRERTDVKNIRNGVWVKL